MTPGEQLAYLLRLKSVVEKSWLNKYMRIEIERISEIPMANVPEHYIGQTYIKIGEHGKERLSNYPIEPAVYSSYSMHSVAKLLKEIAMNSPILEDEIVKVMWMPKEN